MTDDPQKDRINEMWPDGKSPEQLERYWELEKEFDEKYKGTLESVFDNTFPEITWKISGNFQNNNWNLKIAINSEIENLPLSETEKKEILNQINIKIDSPDFSWKESSIETIDVIKNHKERPEYPVLNALKNNWKITIKNMNDILENLSEVKSKPISNKKEWSKVLLKAWVEWGVSSEIINLYGDKSPEQRMQDFWTDTKAPKNVKDNKIMQLVAQNYIRFSDGDNKNSPEKDTILAMQTTANKIILWKSFNRKTPWFTDAMEIINTWENKEKMYDALQTIFTITNNSQWKSAKWRARMLLEKGKKNKWVQSQIDELIILLSKENDKSKKNNKSKNREISRNKLLDSLRKAKKLFQKI